ncbi:MAG: hypothetical protein Q9227_009232 [Pyrenula ochraceoflavens]
MPTAVVTGANSGIGHAFAEILIEEHYDVIAVDINLGEKINALKCQKHEVDVGDPQSIATFKANLGEVPINVLLNIAGVIASKESDALHSVSLDVLKRIFATNTYGPLLLTQALLPNVLAAASSEHPAHLGFMSSRVGSIADNSTGGSYAYRSSKAALNSICKSMSVELKEKDVVVVVMHPGYVKTGLNADTHSMPEAVMPDEAAGKLWKVFQKIALNDTGKFWHREGYELPW